MSAVTAVSYPMVFDSSRSNDTILDELGNVPSCMNSMYLDAIQNVTSILKFFGQMVKVSTGLHKEFENV